MTDLTGKVAVITGGARGQGAAEARLFVERGAKVVIADVLDEQAAQLAAELGADNAVAVHLDVTSAEGWQEALQRTTAVFGRVDILINNAGVFFHAPITETPVDRYRTMIEVNQVGVFLGMQAVAPYMSTHGGSIVNIVSISAYAPLDQTAGYASTKSALLAMSKAAVVDLGPMGIRVNMIHPGGVATEMGAPEGSVPPAYERTPLGRIGEPHEIATVAAFLASDDSSYCSGAEIVVDGGWTVGTRNPWAADA